MVANIDFNIRFVFIKVFGLDYQCFAPLSKFEKKNDSNMESRNQHRINVHVHLPIVFECRNVIHICVGNFFEQVFFRFFDSSKPSQSVNYTLVNGLALLA